MVRAARPVCVAIALVVLVAPACARSNAGPGRVLTIVVNAPFSLAPYVGTTIAQGAELAADQINANGGIPAAGVRDQVRIERLDTGLSAERAVDNIRRAVSEHAVAIVDEGTGVDASWSVANAAHIPIGIVYQGGEGLVNSRARPNVFRIAPTDHGMAFRLAEYLIPKGLRIALVHDDSDYGQQGAKALDEAFSRNRSSVAIELTVPANAPSLAAQMLQARRANSTALLVWGLPTTIAETIRAARSSGWTVPVYTPAAGEDPLVRRELAGHPSWVDGLTFATGRMTAEKGPAPFLAFERAYEQRFGADDTGVKTSTAEQVFQPPDYAMYAYDFVNLVAAAVQAAHGGSEATILRSMTQVDIHGANGDERSFNEIEHEGVVDDDVCFNVFHDMTYAPVKDDPLSATLPVIAQTRRGSP